MLVNGTPLQDAIINGRKMPAMKQQIDSIRHRGIMTMYSTLGEPAVMRCVRRLFPSRTQALALEQFEFENISSRTVSLAMDELRNETVVDTARATRGPHRVIVRTIGAGSHEVAPGEKITLAVYYAARHEGSAWQEINAEDERRGREARIDTILGNLRLETPDPVLNTEFRFAKIRATESIYKTRGGYMHSPGGLAYYAAVWANDQAEYVNPFFAMLGDDLANQSAMNSYRLFARYINPEYTAIPSSIVAEGDGYWNGAGDRGDMAMIAYGASRFALSYGQPDTARVLWPLITWCLEYCRRHVNADGVVTSDTDELERRFPSGNANLSTSTLYYDALNSAGMLGRALGESRSVLERYERQRKDLRTAIERYFGSTVEGFDTYRYYRGNDVLRSWICLPLCMGIFDRKDGTIEALFSPRLWTKDGLATQAGDKTFWDRSTLYALRGVLQAGETSRAMEYLRYYSRRRLLGDHVPYPVEAFPEGNQRHLAAESGLYCRIFTEGLFGIRPVGLNSFSCTPRLPAEWNDMALRNIHGPHGPFDIEISRVASGRLLIVVHADKTQKFVIRDGASAVVKL
jgi:hypothetical protein